MEKDGASTKMNPKDPKFKSIVSKVTKNMKKGLDDYMGIKKFSDADRSRAIAEYRKGVIGEAMLCLPFCNQNFTLQEFNMICKGLGPKSSLTKDKEQERREAVISKLKSYTGFIE